MYTKFRHDTAHCYDGNDSDIHTSQHWYNPVLIPYHPFIWMYIVSLIQAASHMVVPQMPPFITGVTHWEAMHVFLFRYCIIYVQVKWIITIRTLLRTYFNPLRSVWAYR